MKYLLTLLLLCSLAHAGDSPRSLLCPPDHSNDSSHLDINISSPLHRANTPFSKSLTEMPSIDEPNKHKLGSHRRKKSKTILSVNATSPCPSPARPPTPLRSNSMHYPLGIHKTGLVPIIPIHDEPVTPAVPSAPMTTLLQQELDELRSENQMLKEKLEKITEIDQLRKDQAMLEINLTKWRAKQQDIRQEVAGREKHITTLVQTIGDVATTMASLDSGDLLNKIAILTHRQEETQRQQLELLASVRLLLEQQTAPSSHAPQNSTPASKEKKPMSARFGELGNIFSGSRIISRPDSTR